jgi:transcriptional regulator with XRE-family HTH domain
MIVSPRRLGTVIKELRERRGLTQEELAKRSGVSQGYIAKLEPSSRAGKSKTVRKANPSVAILKRLARALGVPVTELLE